ncbi:MAG: sulfatase [bacterium]|nr:sulfatase [bacterium]
MKLHDARLLLLTALAGAALSCGPTTTTPSNFLLITLDTLRADRLGAYGYPRPTSPHLDAFAARSTVFRDVTCSMPTTLPSHLTILTGLAPDQHGVMQNGVLPASDLVSTFDLLREVGLETAAVVSSGVLEERFLQGLGFARVLDDDLEKNFHQLPASTVTDRALELLAARGSRPFALWLHYFDTHEPYTPPANLAEAFAGDYDGPFPESIDGRLVASLNDPELELSPADREHVSNLYDAEVAYLDSELGRLFAYLEESGLTQSTLVVIVGDHGQALGELNHWGHGEWLLEPIIKVPLILRLPGQRQGRQVESPAETLDVAPTVAEFFGLSSPAGSRGRSLAPALSGASLEPSGGRIVVRRRYQDAPERRGVAFLRGGEKWVYYRDGAGESFHLGRRAGAGGLDGESTFSADSEAAARFSELVRSLDDISALPGDLSTETRDMLRSLGYLP